MAEGEVDEGYEHDVGFVVADEDTPVAFEAADEPLDFVSSFVDGLVVGPGSSSGAFGWDDRCVSEVAGCLAGLVSFVCPVGY